MIELAPQHKFGLVIDHPVMPAAGFYGYGQPILPTLLPLAQFGALVTNPITLRPRSHISSPQALESSGGVIFNTTPRNPGIKKIIQQYRKFWRQAPTPIIGHLPTDDPADLTRTVRALSGLELLSGFELGLPRDVSERETQAIINAVLKYSELPLLCKLPLTDLATDEIMALATLVLDLGVDALAIGMPPIGVTLGANGVFIEGDYYGGGLVAQRVPLVMALRNHFPDVPLIASGGIHTLTDVTAYLEAGVTAVQLDTLIFTNPKRAGMIIHHFKGADSHA